MREIKFRGKRVDGGGWVHGDLATKYVHHCGLTIESLKDCAKSVRNWTQFRESIEEFIGRQEDGKIT